MASVLLTTKLYIPPVRHELMPRPRLLASLEKGMGRKLTLVSAPAGFGKTTLISQWAHSLRHAVAWISLDEGDNNPIQFLRYLLTGLGMCLPGIETDFEGMLNAPPQPSPSLHNTVARILNTLAETQRAVIIVLDDYQTISETIVHQAVEFLIENRPPNVHVVITTRRDPPFPLARWRARAQLSEIRAGDLRCTEVETATFLNEKHNLALSPEAIEQLNKRTEGWIAGLQLAAVSMSSRGDCDAFIRTFAGDHRHLMDYLTDEVLAQQPAEIQEFLLKTAILERMTAPLCDAVLSQTGSSDILDHVDTANLFVVRLDDRREWYRYHRLFADLLRFRLEQTYASLLPELHRRASHWLESHGFVYEAMEHAFKTNDPVDAVRIFERHAQEAVMRGDVRYIIDWTERLTRERLLSSPILSVSAAWAYFLVSRFDHVHELLGALEAHDYQRIRDYPNSEVWIAQGLTLRSFLDRMAGETQRGIHQAEKALQLVPDEDNFLQGLLYTSLGSLYRDVGNIAHATEAQQRAIEMSRQAGNMSAAAMAVYNFIVLLLMQGKLQQALSECQRIINISGKTMARIPAFGAVHVSLGELYYEQNALVKAENALETGINLSQRGGYEYAEVLGTMNLAWVRYAQGKHEEARALMEKIATAAQNNPPTAIRYAAKCIKLWLALGDLSAAQRWVQEQGLKPTDAIHPHTVSNYITLARVQLAAGRASHDSPLLADTLTLLTRILAELERWGADGTALETQLLVALAYHAHGADAKAAIALTDVLPLATREGYKRTFIDEGAPMADLLRLVNSKGQDSVYTEDLLTAFPTPSATTQKPRAVVQVEALTEQETRVLRLIDSGMTNHEIAEALTITLNTVKTHTRNLYSKLNVHSRVQAIVRSRELGLL